MKSPNLIWHVQTGGFCNLCFISSNAFSCSTPQTNCLPFLVKSFIGFNNFCNSGQNILTKLTIPAKLLHCLAVVGCFIFCIASYWLCRGFTQTLLSFINMVFPIYWSSVLNNWHFLGDFFNPFFLKAFKRSSNFAICTILLGVNNN